MARVAFVAIVAIVDEAVKDAEMRDDLRAWLGGLKALAVAGSERVDAACSADAA